MRPMPAGGHRRCVGCHGYGVAGCFLGGHFVVGDFRFCRVGGLHHGLPYDCCRRLLHSLAPPPPSSHHRDDHRHVVHR